MQTTSKNKMESSNLIKSINWIITNKCNLKCTHCDIWNCKDKNEFNLKTIEKILNKNIIKKSYEKYKNNFDISLGGGEPFLKKDLQEIVDLIEKKFPGSLKTISTNGLLTEKILKFVKKNYHLKFKLNISLDGIGNTHDKIRGLNGAFKKTLKTTYQIRKLFPKQKIELKLTLLPENYNQILKVYLLASKLNCDFSFKPAENMKNYTNQIRNIPTQFTKEQLCIIRNQCFKLADIMYEEKKYSKAKFFQDIPFYLANKKKPTSCSVIPHHITIMPDQNYFFCIKEPTKGNIFENSIKSNLKIDSNFKCKSCMLMCGAYKDYSNNFFNKKTANMEITLKCNLNCEMCTQKEFKKNPEKDMSLITFKEIVNKNNIIHVSFMGGESFLNNDFFKIMNYLDSSGITYEITTNGTLITGNILEKLKNCIGLKKINFSLDGLKEYHNKERGKNVFEKCIQALKTAKNIFNINVCTIIKNDNINDIPRLTEYLIKLGIKNQKIIYGMNLSKQAREHSIKKIPKLNLRGPQFNNQLKNPKIINNLFKKLDKIQQNFPIKISYEPEIIRKNLKSFLEGDIIHNKNIYCKQMNQARFNTKGDRILCEFIRNKFTQKRANYLSNHLLPICENCCKLEMQDLIKYKTKIVNKIMQKNHKISLMIEPTNRCNLKCPTCFSHQDGRTKKDMSLKEFKKIIDENIQLIKNLSLYNYGEPLLNPEIYDMIKYAKNKGVKSVKLATNGMLLNDKNINLLLESSLDYLSISLDGATPETYSKFRIGGNFDKIISNIKKLVNQRNKKNSNTKIEIQFIIMSHNQHEIKDIKNLSKKLGADFLRLKKVLIKNPKWSALLPLKEKYDRYSEKKNFSKCDKPLKELVINCDGTIIPCCYIVGKNILKFNLGNITNHSLLNILNSKKYNHFIKNCLNEKNKNSCCIGCNEGNLKLDYKIINLNDK